MLWRFSTTQSRHGSVKVLFHYSEFSSSSSAGLGRQRGDRGAAFSPFLSTILSSAPNSLVCSSITDHSVVFHTAVISVGTVAAMFLKFPGLILMSDVAFALFQGQRSAQSVEGSRLTSRFSITLARLEPGLRR